MSNTTYDDPSQYNGKEWNELLKCFNKRDLRASLKGAYRTVGKEILSIARGNLTSSGLSHASKMKSGIRLRVYPNGYGFMITVKPHGKQGFHVNRFGLEKPVLMWAEEGTKGRHVRLGGQKVQTADAQWRMLGRRRGKMPAYHFLAGVESEGAPIIERDISSALESQVMRTASENGF